VGVRNRRIPAIELIEEVPGLPKALVEYATGQEVPEHDSVQVFPVWEYVTYNQGVDSVLLFEQDGEPQFAAQLEFIEHQFERFKSVFWPLTVAASFSHYGCPTVKVAIADSPDAAEWARQPIDTGQMVMRTPAVCLSDIEPGDDLGLGLLAAISKLAEPKGFSHLADRLAALDFQQAQRIANIMDIGMRDTPSGMTWRRHAETAGYDLVDADMLPLRLTVRDADRYARRAAAALMLLRARDLEVSEDVRRYVLTCDSAYEFDRLLELIPVVEEAESHLPSYFLQRR
jgi:hypothetical protein